MMRGARERAFWGFERPQLVAPVTRERRRLRGRDPARWKEGAILRFLIGGARLARIWKSRGRLRSAARCALRSAPRGCAISKSVLPQGLRGVFKYS